VSKNVTMTLRHLRELRQADTWLLEILDLAAELAEPTTIRITSIYRTPKEDIAAGGKSGVHYTIPHRAIDIAGSTFKGVHGVLYELRKLANKINRQWSYDPSRPQLKVAVAHGPVPHLHIQTHPNTRRNNPRHANQKLSV
jgi:hypothetical protein